MSPTDHILYSGLPQGSGTAQEVPHGHQLDCAPPVRAQVAAAAGEARPRRGGPGALLVPLSPPPAPTQRDRWASFSPVHLSALAARLRARPRPRVGVEHRLGFGPVWPGQPSEQSLHEPVSRRSEPPAPVAAAATTATSASANGSFACARKWRRPARHIRSPQRSQNLTPLQMSR